MNLQKLQIETMKQVLKQERNVRYCSDGEYTIITFDGYAAFRIPNKYMLLDLSKMQEQAKMKTFFDRRKNEKVGKLSKTQICGPNGIMLKIMCDEKSAVYVNKRLFITYFNDHSILVTNSREHVQLVNDVTGEIEAVVLPTIYHGGED